MNQKPAYAFSPIFFLLTEFKPTNKSIAYAFAVTLIFLSGNAYCQLSTSKVLKQVYLINRDGAEIKQYPDSLSETISGAQFGEKLDVVKINKYWLAVAVNNKYRIGYVKKSAVTSDETKIPLTNEDLKEIYDDNNEGPEPHPNIELSLITKQQFYAMKKTAVNYFIADTNIIRKHKRTIKLPVKNGFKTLVDEPDYNKIDSNINQYIGQYPTLNKYLIMNCDGEAEGCNYTFIDKTTGKSNVGGFDDFPYLSIDKKTIVSLQANDYHNYAELYVYKFVKHSWDTYVIGEYKNWMPVRTGEQFWGIDNCFYVPVLPSVAYYPSYAEKKGANYNYRYIKIKIKGPTMAPHMGEK